MAPIIMEYKIEQYERVDTMHEGSIEDILIGVTKPSMDRLLKMQNPGDCIALYTLYCYIRKWQKNSNVFATSEYVMKALDWGRDRFSRAKNQLVEAKFIEDVKVRTEEKKIDGWYVKVRYAMNATLGKFHTTEIPQGGNSADKYPLLINEIPFNGNEILMRDQRREEFVLSSKIQVELNDARAKTEIEMQSAASDFETFYSAYPRKVSKTNAEKAWKKQKCVLSEVMPSLQKQMKLWNDPQFIPHPATWLNGRRWEDDLTTKSIPTQQTAYKNNSNANLAQRKREWYDVCEERGERETFKAWLMDNRPEEWSDFLPSMDVRWWVEFCDRSIEF
jgi:hypothetical protein